MEDWLFLQTKQAKNIPSNKRFSVHFYSHYSKDHYHCQQQKSIPVQTLLRNYQHQNIKLFIVTACYFQLQIQQIPRMNYTRQNFNKSSISYKQFSQTPPNPQHQRIYAYKSRIFQNMKDDCSSFTFTQPKFYQNKIFHSTHKYNVPVQEYSKSERQNNTSYQQFLTVHRKFTKPYGQLTKFTDTLNHNNHLLRRAQFDTPLTTSVQLPSNKTKVNRSIRYMRHTAKPMKQDKIEERKDNSALKNNYFDKSLGSQLIVFKRLFEKERTQKSDWIGLNNSMNRILSTELIDSQIRGRSTRVKTQVQ